MSFVASLIGNEGLDETIPPKTKKGPKISLGCVSKFNILLVVTDCLTDRMEADFDATENT